MPSLVRIHADTVLCLNYLNFFSPWKLGSHGTLPVLVFWAVEGGSGRIYLVLCSRHCRSSSMRVVGGWLREVILCDVSCSEKARMFLL